MLMIVLKPLISDTEHYRAGRDSSQYSDSYTGGQGYDQYEPENSEYAAQYRDAQYAEPHYAEQYADRHDDNSGMCVWESGWLLCSISVYMKLYLLHSSWIPSLDPTCI